MNPVGISGTSVMLSGTNVFVIAAEATLDELWRRGPSMMTTNDMMQASPISPKSPPANIAPA